MADYQFLEPLQFNNGITLKNKIVMAPMTIQCLAFIMARLRKMSLIILLLELEVQEW
ncbi:hypothetical protein TEHAL1_05950 [Tetragenococcus halophilus]|nr:hypothetical protein TEHAB4_22050 [Tetragenococcus halophilus]GMG63121.1 hypothetical protein TEHAL1_05950 [Tetragenococcus halophilus]